MMTPQLTTIFVTVICTVIIFAVLLTIKEWLDNNKQPKITTDVKVVKKLHNLVA